MNARENRTLLGIAQTHLQLETLDARSPDALALSVWQVRSALEAAYRAGVARSVRCVRVFGRDAREQAADATYQNRMSEARRLLAVLAELLDHHNLGSSKDPTSWAFVGDLGELNKALSEAAICITPEA